MKTTLCLFTLCLASGLLPAMALEADMDKDGGTGGGTRPRAKKIRIPLIQIEVESETIHVLFASDLGIVNLQLRDATGFTAVDQQIDTSAQNEVSFCLPAGSYTLTATTADETIITQVIVIIP